MACIITLNYVIVVCFQMNLTARFIEVQHHAEKHLFLYQKTYKARFTKFRAIEQTLTRIRTCEQLQKFYEHEQESTKEEDEKEETQERERPKKKEKNKNKNTKRWWP